jgi:enoyl-CoA hydratase
MGTYETITVEVENRLCIITLNRPDKFNAISEQMLRELHMAFEDLSASRDIDVGIITGNGKAFMAGADIPEILGRTTEENKAYNQEIIKTFQLLECMNKPVIAAINGHAMGGGLEMALACTFRIATVTSKLGLPEVGLGMIPGTGGPARLLRSIGKQQAMRLILTGDIIGAEEALALGLVMKVVPQEKLMEEAKDLARRILRNAPLAVHFAKDAVEMGMDMTTQQAIKYAERSLEVLAHSEDAQEGIKAFVEKRKPNFKGR